MYVSRVVAENFRVFGSKLESKHLDLEFDPGLNVLVGENDSGKTSIIDAIRYALLTTSQEYVRIQEDDFHIQGGDRASSLSIEVELRGLSVSQQGALLEWLSYSDGQDPYLVVRLEAQRRPPGSPRRGGVEVTFRCGHGGTGLEVGSAVRDMSRATYLRPLRDAEAELRPGRQSRLSQILAAHKAIAGQERSDFSPDTPTRQPTTLVGFMDQAQYHIGKSPIIAAVQTEVNETYLRNVAFVGETLISRVRVASAISLQQILERLELALSPPGGIDTGHQCARGLGYNNVLFMSTELVLLHEGDELALLLVEEPEAHLHPQLQARILELFQAAAGRAHPVQIILSTHSPNLACSAPIESLTLVAHGRPYRLAKGETMLEETDYEFLRRFLDVTKANLFFARAVAMVEGHAEALLLPALAEACGRSFSSTGVSVVNVASTGLFRYARILQRRNGPDPGIPVACITDRDIVPSHVGYVDRGRQRIFADELGPTEVEERVSARRARAEGGGTRVFVADHWTFEYDLAASGCARLMLDAVSLAEAAEGNKGYLTAEEEQSTLSNTQVKWDRLALLDNESKAATIYESLYRSKVSKSVVAQYAAKLVRGGGYGRGEVLLHALPAYLREALAYLVGPLTEEALR